jgi:hypothetical protein
MKIVQETTVWKDVSYQQPNHVYLMDGDKVLAYVKWGQGSVEYLSKPLRIDRRGRKFVEVPDQWGFETVTLEPQGRSWNVTGSKGATYTVTEHEGTWACTCSGFIFRGRCRHVAEIAETV